MTNRIPLIVNPGAAQIQELAAGDNLDLNGGSLANVSDFSVVGNVTGDYFIGNGSLLTGITAGSSYGNSNVADYLPTYTGNVGVFSLDETGTLETANGVLDLRGNGYTGLVDVDANIRIVPGSKSWSLNTDGSVLNPIIDTNGRTGTAQTIAFASFNQQAAITGPAPVDGEFNTAPRLVIAGRDGINSGEGGDLYLWAGASGPGGGSGGDIKIDGGEGYANSEGGTIKIRGGYSNGDTGGFIEIYAGSGTYGAPVDIRSGQGSDQANTGNVTIFTPYGGTWTFDRYANLTTPGNIIVSSGGNISVPGGSISAAGNVDSTAVSTQTAVISTGVIANTITLGNSAVQVSSFDWVSAMTATTTAAILWQAPISTLASVDFNITVTNEATSERQVTQIIAVAMDTNFSYNEYGSLRIGNILSDLTIDSSGGNLRLLSTPATTDTLDHTVVVQISYDMNQSSGGGGIGGISE